MSAFQFKLSVEVLGSTIIARIRKFCGLSIGEIQRRARSHEPLIEIPILSGDWPKAKATVIALLGEIESGQIPLTVSEARLDSDGYAHEELLDLAQARRRLQFLQDIALEQDMHAQLEEGYISSPAEYESNSEDET